MQLLLETTSRSTGFDLYSRPSFQPEQVYLPLKDFFKCPIRAPLRGSKVTFIPIGRPLPLSTDWRVRLVTDGSVSRHLNKKFSPSLGFGMVRGVTNTVEESAGSGRNALLETEGYV